MKLKMRNKVTPEFTMAAMTDFVFQLLIIFMLISTLANEDANLLDMNLPTATPTSKSATNVVVSVDMNFKYFVGTNPVEKDQIINSINQMTGGDKTKTVELAIDENVPHKYFVELVDIISVQNGYKIGIQTKPPDK